MADLKFTVIQELGVLSEGSKGGRKEINRVSWNDRSPKMDIRDWNANHERMGKGITLNKEELKVLKGILNGIDLDSLDLA